ncbi:dienelactone hydrolase [Paraphoma chrysanthemicola]|uniref:Dienelactone hydrolase n=1 Tax=Paraphoma chrysanthemicola TaxID=798071 RepID=A0A8K0R0F1_9PLEO|nr:dienelactone hydrolase [Paraphoma chrysanthemicola]
MASGAMQQCCVSGVLHSGTPTGEVATIAENVKAYIAQTPDKTSKHAIILLTDVYGYTFRNSQLLADHFALNGYVTVIPDLFKGNEVPFPRPDGWSLQEYIATTMPRTDTVDPIIEKTVAWLRNEKGISKIGGAGYCFGGKYVVRWLKGPGVGLDAGYVAHPSFTEADELWGMKGPLSIAAAETDDVFPREKRHETEDILAKHNVPYQLFLYSDVEHGFAVRGELQAAKAKFAKEQAFKQALSWFEEFLKKEDA